MKRLTLIVISLLLLLSSIAQTASWSWEKGIGGGTDHAVSIVTDKNGDVFIAGTFTGDSMIVEGFTLINHGGTDIFLIKYSGSGNVIWAKSYGGINYDVVTNITTDINGNLLMVGNFNSSTISFGANTLTTYGGSDIYVTKIDGLGNVLWAIGEGGSSEEYGYDIVTDNSGNVFITADFNTSSITVGTTTLTNLGSADILFAKYSPAGVAVWARHFGGSGSEHAYSLASDVTGNIVITGRVNSSSMTDDGTNTISINGVSGMFLIKYNSLGTFLWSQSWGGSALDYGMDVGFDYDNNIILLMSLGDTVMTAGTITLHCQYISHALIKYDPNGNAMWGEICSGGKNDAMDLAIDAQGSIYLTGYYHCPQIVFGTNYLNNTNSSFNHHDMLIVKYDALGNELWGLNEGGNDDDYGYRIVADINGDMIVMGSFVSSTMTFGSSILGHNYSGFYNQTYLSKLNCPSLGINNAILDDDFLIYPNPLSSEALLSFTYAQKDTYIEIVDIFGRAIKNTIFTGKQLKIEMTGMAAGIYFVNVVGEGNKMLSKKIIVQ